MDITSKYRTKFPPREHEEAVRMLLEGINGTQTTTTTTTTRQEPARQQIGGQVDSSKEANSSNSYEYDERSVQSLSTQSTVSSEGDLVTNRAPLHNQHLHQSMGLCTEPPISARRQKGLTGAHSDDSSSSGIDHDAAFREPIPSRTIAVQCDLKSSSIKRLAGGASEIDGSMQASSISSTRYGFYNFTPETLEHRRKMLQRSVSSRELAPSGAGARGGQNEAPTSMSELSVSDNELNSTRRLGNSSADHHHRYPVQVSHHQSKKRITPTGSSSYSSSSSSSSSYVKSSARAGLKVSAESAKGGWRQQVDQSLDSPTLERRATTRRPTTVEESSQTARAKINSLPRRPMTALSYVSTTKLRGDQQMNRDDDDDSGSDLGRSRLIKSRAMSQQTLTRPRTPANTNDNDEIGSSDSESELARRGVNRARGHIDAPTARKLQSQEGMRGRLESSVKSRSPELSPAKPPRPTLVSSKHEEQVLDYRTLERNPGAARPSVLQDRGNLLEPSRLTNHKYGSQRQMSEGLQPVDQHPTSGLHRTASREPHRHTQYGDKFATIDRSHRVAADEHMKDSYESEYTARLRSHQRPLLRPLVGGGERLVNDRIPVEENLPPLKLDTEYQVPAQRSDQFRYQNSMSLSRRPRAPPMSQPPRSSAAYSAADQEQNIARPEVGEGYFTTSRIRPHKLSRADRAYSQMHLSSAKPLNSYLSTLPPAPVQQVQEPMSVRRVPAKSRDAYEPEAEIPRSTLLRHHHHHHQMERPLAQDRYATGNAYATPVQDPMGNSGLQHDSELHHSSDTSRELAFKGKYPMNRDFYSRDNLGAEESDPDSESPLTRTWANPSFRSNYAHAELERADEDPRPLNSNRKSSRSYSMRDVNAQGAMDNDYNGPNEHRKRYEDYSLRSKVRKNDFSSYNSSSEEASSMDNANRFPSTASQHQNPLDYNSQHRLNEIGLPEINPLTGIMSSRRHPEPSSATGSYLGLSSGGYPNATTTHSGLYTTGRAPQITGRALSQQSLTRPTMPLTGARRRAGSNHSGSDVGGSSMSLVSRLHGRYENAHTRTPVVMYIPKAMPRASSYGDGTSLLGKAGTLSRKGSRSRQKSSSQDRSRRSSSRNGSDSESSSMLRTLVKPRSRLQSNYSSKRSAARHIMHDDEDEDIDGIGQLASEMDSYKFRRRYSVPKDAKINWFAKLKQRVSSGSKQ